VPSFTLARPGSGTQLRFAAIPMGHEFTSLVLALLWTGGHPPKVEPEVIEQIKALDGTWIRGLHEPVLPQLPGRGAGALADGHPQPAHQDHRHRRRHVPEEIEAREIMGVPSVFRAARCSTAAA
jgi:alkyl hydroperoxide reductase subunit F